MTLCVTLSHLLVLRENHAKCVTLGRYEFPYFILIIHQSLLSRKLVHNGGFQTLNCHYSFGIQPMWPKFRAWSTFITKSETIELFILILDISSLYNSRLVVCCNNIKDWSTPSYTVSLHSHLRHLKSFAKQSELYLLLQCLSRYL